MTRRIVPLVLAILAISALVVSPVGARAQPTDASTATAADEELLQRGDAGPQVEALQEQLNEWIRRSQPGRDELAVDGIFGPRTEAATLAFQAAAGLAVDGIVGPRTRAALPQPLGAGPLEAEDVLSSAIDTRPDTGAASGPPVSVTAVRVGTHDGFDRVTFEIGGDGQVGWDVRYVDAARSQGSGHPLDVPGDAVLSVSLRNVAYPVDPPAGVDPWDGPDRIDVGTAGPALAVVEDTVFEGHHAFFVGVTGEHPFQVRRFDSPQRVVLDVAAPGRGASEPAGSPIGDLARCESPEGFAIDHPASWSTNDDGPVGPCTQFHPEPFDVPVGTDERVAAITAYIDPVPFSEVAAPDAQRDAERAATVIDGLQAVRLEFEAEDALWPEGTPVTMYAVDLAPGVDEDPRTLFVDTVGLPSFDYERNQVVLDAIAHSVAVTRDDVETEPQVVARYEGGGGAFRVEGRLDGGQACLRIPPRGEPVCTEAPAADAVRTVQLDDLQPVLAGVTGDEIHAVTAERRDGSTSTVLPAPIPDSALRGFAFPFGPDDVVRLRLADVTGADLETVQLGG